jgi:ribosomal protein L12E/L44/L45/RPP1/RPP2
MEKCHICNTECDWSCGNCGYPVCDSCTVAYDQFTQIDYTLCNTCGERHNDARANEYFSELEEQKIAEKIKEEKNKKARDYYHSEKAREKRQLRKIQLQELRKKESEERVERLAGLFFNIFKHM